MANRDERKRSKRRRSSQPGNADLRRRIRTSVGRGVEALFASDTTTSTTTSSNVSTVPEASPGSDNNHTLEAMLEREASAAGDVREEVVASTGADTPEGPPPEAASAEATPTEHTEGAEPPAAEEEVADRELDKLYVPSEEEPPRERIVGEAATETTLPPEAAETTAVSAPPPVVEETPTPVDVTPPRLRPTGILVETPMTVETTPPGPGAHVQPGIPEPERQPATLSREEILSRISKERFDQLEQEIDELYNTVPSVLVGSKSNVDEALTALRDARELLWTSPERLVDAEYKVKYVRVLLERSKLSESWGRTYGRRILVYQLAWLILFMGGFLYIELAQGNIAAWVAAVIGPAGATYASLLTPFLTSLMWGGIGGVVGALYSLWWHVSEVQDFDKRYTMWYLVQPIMGFVLGGIVYLIIGTGFLALQGTVPNAESAIGVQLFPALVAVLGGFRQKFVYELLERIIRVLTPQQAAG